MKELTELIQEDMKEAFIKAGYDGDFAKVTVSKRPDLCEYQVNGAMAAAKKYKKAPLEIATSVVSCLNSSLIGKADVVSPGFINLTLDSKALSLYLEKMAEDERFGLEPVKDPKNIMMDYGGPNVAKPLHVGHLRSAVIGESIKRILEFTGNKVMGDIHLGDWGTQMGLIITELKIRKPDLPYFDPEYTGDYPKEPPFTMAELEEIYPTASAKSKKDKEYHEKALEATRQLQDGRRGYVALWKHIMHLSVNDLKKNYERLNVSFDLWKGESDSKEYIGPMVEKMKADGFAYVSNGALVCDVSQESDKKTIPPCMLLKTDGAALYDTTDLATLVWRMKDYHPDRIIYVVDKRQELHFIQVFRCARKTGIVPDSTDLTFIGFGTMNGKDGHPFKTREGGVMRLSTLLDDVESKMLEKISSNDDMSEEEACDAAKKIALAAVKYGDLQNVASKDYIFDVDQFTAFEGNTGPYILYTIVRIKSILKKYKEKFGAIPAMSFGPADSGVARELELSISGFQRAVRQAADELAPSRICAYIYDLSEKLNKFYHETKILAIEDVRERENAVSLVRLAMNILNKCIDMLGFSAPDKM